MTKNQIEFLKYQESQRSNRQQEMLTRNRDYNTFVLGSRQAAETERANRVSEGLRSRDLDQQLRRNEQSYAISSLQLEESRRANLAREAENQRSNLARESQAFQEYLEKQRSNMATESLGAQTLGVRRSELAESVRANMARENEQSRYNAGVLNLRQSELEETRRHNVQQEALSNRQAEASVSQARAALMQAGARVKEVNDMAQYRAKQIKLDSARLDESVRSNVARENELMRHNIASESLDMQRLEDYYSIQSSTLAEQERSHRSNESISRFSAATSALRDVSKFAIPLFGGTLS